MMRALSLLQPWASLVEVGAKKIETRSWKTSYRGTLLIHASMSRKRLGVLTMYPWLGKPLVAAGYRAEDSVPFGAVVAVCDLVDCVPITKNLWPLDLSPQEEEYGDYSAGRFAWKLANVRRLKKPIPYKGALGLWRPGGDLVAEVGHQLGVRA